MYYARADLNAKSCSACEFTERTNTSYCKNADGIKKTKKTRFSGIFCYNCSCVENLGSDCTTVGQNDMVPGTFLATLAENIVPKTT